MNRWRLLITGLLLVLFVRLSVNSFGQTPGLARDMRVMSESFSRGTQGIWFLLGFIAFIFALVVGVIGFNIYVRRRLKAGIDNPRYLFIALVRAHELTWVERQFLADFADRSDLENPLPLFFEPKHFLAALDDDRFRESHQMIEYLLKKLFDIDPENFVPPKKQAEKTLRGETTIMHPFADG